MGDCSCGEKDTLAVHIEPELSEQSDQKDKDAFKARKQEEARYLCAGDRQRKSFLKGRAIRYQKVRSEPSSIQFFFFTIKLNLSTFGVVLANLFRAKQIQPTWLTFHGFQKNTEAGVMALPDVL